MYETVGYIEHIRALSEQVKGGQEVHPLTRQHCTQIRDYMLAGASIEQLVSGGFNHTTVRVMLNQLKNDGFIEEPERGMHILYFEQRSKICIECGAEFKTYYRAQECCTNCRITSDYTAYLKLRFAVFTRDNFRCVYCGRTPTEDNVKLVTDHVIPSSRGGDTTMENLVTSCTECNIGKSDILLELRKNGN